MFLRNFLKPVDHTKVTKLTCMCSSATSIDSTRVALEERLQIIERETEARVHVVQMTKARDHVFTALLQRHGIHVATTAKAGPETPLRDAIFRL